jgi:FdhD protein
LNIVLAENASIDSSRLAFRRGTVIASSCGMCGRRSIDDLLEGLAPLWNTRLHRGMLSRLTESLRVDQPGFAQTGGVHAAGIANQEGRYRVVREDIGRHMPPTMPSQSRRPERAHPHPHPV